MATAALSPTAVHSSPGGVMRPDVTKMKLKGAIRKDKLDDSYSGSLHTPHEDPLRILAPAQKKLTTIESQRVLAVMDEVLKRLESALVLPFLSSSLQRYSVSLGVELVAMMEEYQLLVAVYNQLYGMVFSSHGLAQQLREVSSRSSLLEARRSNVSLPSSEEGGSGRLEPLGHLSEEAAEERFYETRDRLKHVVKCILRALGRSPSTTSIVQASASDRSRMATQLVDAVSDLRGVVNEKLLTSRVEEVRREEHLKRVGLRQQQAEEQIHKLEAELAEAVRIKDEEISKKNAQIKKLKSDIKTVLTLSEDVTRRLHGDTVKQRTSHEEEHREKRAQLQEEIATVRRKLQEAVQSNRNKEQDLRKRAFKRETEVENWIQKYDNEMGEKQDEFEELDTEFTEEKRQLKELEEKLEVLTVEYGSVVKEQEEERAKAEAAAKRMSEMVQAAHVIQRVWRAYYKQKKLLKEQQKGKKGKKGKGKGKGKGKKKKK